MTTDANNETEEYTILSTQRVDGGVYHRIRHPSPSAGGLPMTFGLFVPSRHAGNVVGGKETEKEKDNVPVMFWLSGLTCDGEFRRPPDDDRRVVVPVAPLSSIILYPFLFFPSVVFLFFVFFFFFCGIRSFSSSRTNSSPPFFSRFAPLRSTPSVAIYPFFPREKNKTRRWLGDDEYI